MVDRAWTLIGSDLGTFPVPQVWIESFLMSSRTGSSRLMLFLGRGYHHNTWKFIQIQPQINDKDGTLSEFLIARYKALVSVKF